jgi:hypothetical protein
VLDAVQLTVTGDAPLFELAWTLVGGLRIETLPEAVPVPVLSQ